MTSNVADETSLREGKARRVNLKQFSMAGISIDLGNWKTVNLIKLSAVALLCVASVTIPPSIICTRIKGLTSSQMRFCEVYPDTMDSITRGYQLGVEECKFQFRKRRWNCTSLGSKSPFSKRAVSGTKEDAFTHAIISAGIAHSVTLACTEGNITRCGCDKSMKSAKSGGWSWGGCSVNIQRGLQVADQFLNGHDPGRSDIELMSIHNNEVGREVLRNSLVMECKCHGASQSCNVRTCWNRLPSFRTVGKKLHDMYFRNSVKVKGAQPKRSSPLVLVEDQFIKPMRKTKIVYLYESPSYCERNLTLGIPGTKGRTCIKDASDKEADVCDVMCCGRGYDKRIVSRKWKCSCKFHWCCYVKCKLCSEQIIVHSCK